MSRAAVWLCMSGAGFAYWGVRHGFAVSEIDHFTGAMWFGGMSLLLHWFFNRHGASPLPPSPQGVPNE